MPETPAGERAAQRQASIIRQRHTRTDAFMISTPSFIVFIAAALVLALTPGPNMIYLISRSGSRDRPRKRRWPARVTT
ncbi:MAG: hypothetical protein U1E89_02475 [Burkholderiaceae bacterium]